MARQYKPTSPYYTTPIRDFYLDLARFRTIAPNDKDTLYTLPAKYDKRPDLLAFDAYGTPNLWWVFALRNMDILVDPIEDFVAGIEIWVPAPQSVGVEV